MLGTDRAETDAGIHRILIVEDDALIAFDNEYALNDAGFSVVAAVDNAAEARRLIAGGGIDLVMSDVNLRGEGDGVDVALAARDAGIALLFVSGNCPADARGLAIGCLAKPYTQRDLLGSIEAVDAARSGHRAGELPRALTLFGE
ncbi:MAG TPA: response regulator [Sphingomonas sp.]|nr:response regulator [Sphingomonas sp.]